MTTIETIRVHVASGLSGTGKTALQWPGVALVGPDEADVWVVRGDLPPPALPEQRPALVAIGNPNEADAGWYEEVVDAWVADFDAAVVDRIRPPDSVGAGIRPPDSVGAGIRPPDSVGAAIRRAWSSRLALRPEATDRREDWLEAVRTLTGADAVGHVLSGSVTSAGTTTGLEPLWTCRPLLARGARAMVAVPSAASLKERFGLSGTPADGVLVFPLGLRGIDGVLILVTLREGTTWVRRAIPIARMAVDAADRCLVIRRLTQAEADHRRLRETMGRMVGIVSHDLRSPLFAVQLGVKVLERQSAPTQSVAVLNRAVASASDLLRRLVEAGRAVLEPAPTRLSGSADLTAVWAGVAAQIAAQHPAVSVGGGVGSGPDGGPLRVAVDPATLETLLRSLLSNAVIHGSTAAPVAVETEVTDTEVEVRIRNRGRLPFADLAQIDAFEYRANGGLGMGLFLARRLAKAAGVGLSLNPGDGDVEARLRMKLVR